MKKQTYAAVAFGSILLLSAPMVSADEVDCSTADQDIQRLEHEKQNTAERMAKGVTSIMPIGLVVKTVKGTEKEDLNMASGDYNDRIDKSIAAIKQKCGLK